MMQLLIHVMNIAGWASQLQWRCFMRLCRVVSVLNQGAYNNQIGLTLTTT